MDNFNGVLSASFNTLYKASQRQFSNSLGLHLNSKDWKAYIDPGSAKFYNFLLDGIVHTSTHTTTDDKTYEQVIQFSEYKKLESSLLLLFLNKASEADIIHYVVNFLYNTRVKVFCTCPAFKFFGFEYILTRKRSVFGPGEYRYPIEKNPNKNGVYCKHLWVVADSLYKKQLKFAEGLVPFYKRAFGINSELNLEKYKKEVGSWMEKLLEDSKNNIKTTNSKTIEKEFNKLENQYLKNMDEKELKEPKELDQKDDNSEEIKEDVMKNKEIHRESDEKETNLEELDVGEKEALEEK